MDESDEELVRQTEEEEEEEEVEEEEGGRRQSQVPLPPTPLRVSTCEVPRASHRFRFLTNAQ